MPQVQTGLNTSLDINVMVNPVLIITMHASFNMAKVKEHFYISFLLKIKVNLYTFILFNIFERWNLKFRDLLHCSIHFCTS